MPGVQDPPIAYGPLPSTLPSNSKIRCLWHGRPDTQMSNGACLVLTDPRRLSRVRLRTEPEASPPISLLGPDPITDPIPLDTFAAALAKPTAPIKAVLLAQVFVVYRHVRVILQPYPKAILWFSMDDARHYVERNEPGTEVTSNADACIARRSHDASCAVSFTNFWILVE